MALLSIMGLYHYDPTVFNSLHLPEGIDRETLIGNILLECAELEVIISEPEIMKEAIGYWSKKNQNNWQHIYDAMREKYDPLWNKDGTYTETETRDLKSTGLETRNLANSNRETRDLASSADSTGQVSAFNSTGFQNQNRQTASGTDTGTVNNSGTDTGTVNNAGTDTGTISRTRRETGNIGVTTSQAMLTEEVELRRAFNIYDIITEDFKSRFCLLVY